MYTLDIENRQHHSLLEHQQIGVCKLPISMVSAIFSEGFTVTLGTGVYFQWIASLKIQTNILFSVKHSLKCWALDSIFN